MAATAKILVVDDELVTCKTLARLLANQGYEVTLASSGAEALNKVKKDNYELVLVDLIMDDISGLDVLDEVKRNSTNTEVIIMTGYASVDSAIESMKKGAFHYLQKPFHLEECKNLILQAIEKSQLRKQVEQLKSEISSAKREQVIIGKSQKIKNILNLIKQVAATDSNVLITGESGTGKELVASSIHFNSIRAHKNFLPINCGSFTEELLANELFGHEKDAYTGATNARKGLLESADGGSIFFDEIGDMPLSMQAKLLRVIQDRKLIRVGGNKPIPIDVRFIAATNKDLKKSMSIGLFREDLYYRLNVVPIHMPTLSERREDIPMIATFLLNRIFLQMKKEIKGFSPSAMKMLIKYDYPGNIRELENIIERAAALCKKDFIDDDDLPGDLKDLNIFRYDYEKGDIKSIGELEKEYIFWVLEKLDHNKSNTAKVLGIDRASLYRKLKNYSISE
ncbi:sigma-54 dependent transcriptional regulator [bacterium]|nr:sigma-54 dependent transcriptional regulator [bacterium]